MDENGIDKLLVGDKLANPNRGVRITDVTGLTWNEHISMERGGTGTQKQKESNNYIPIMGFEDNTGGEGFHFAQLEDGTQMLRLVYDEGYLLFGQAKPEEMFGNKEPFICFLIIQEKEYIWKTY